MRWFIKSARAIRNFPLKEDENFSDLLEHLNLLDDGFLTNASVLLFGRNPQRFLLSSEIKCAHFHGTRVSKPIPSYQVYKGTVFEIVDQAVDFVLSKLDLSVGTREYGPQAPVKYEIPKEVVTEAIVNAVAHRDYTGNGSVQVMLFSDRLVIWNPGRLPPSLTIEKLKEAHGSVPNNPLLAEPMYLTRYIERMGTGTGDMIEQCRKVNLKEPDFLMTDGFEVVIYRPLKSDKAGLPPYEVTGEVTGEVRRLLMILDAEMTRQEIQERMGLKSEENIRIRYIRPAIESGLIEMTIPDKPQSRLQKYRLTKKGRDIRETESEV